MAWTQPQWDSILWTFSALPGDLYLFISIRMILWVLLEKRTTWACAMRGPSVRGRRVVSTTLRMAVA
jgi:hypothetical protein